MNENSDITLKSRKLMNVTGVDGIVSFSDTEAVFSTSLGFLAVTGNNFKIDGFDKDNFTVTLSGEISAVFYPGGKKENKGFLRKFIK